MLEGIDAILSSDRARMHNELGCSQLEQQLVLLIRMLCHLNSAWGQLLLLNTSHLLMRFESTWSPKEAERRRVNLSRSYLAAVKLSVVRLLAASYRVRIRESSAYGKTEPGEFRITAGQI